MWCGERLLPDTALQPGANLLVPGREVGADVWREFPLSGGCLLNT